MESKHYTEVYTLIQSAIANALQAERFAANGSVAIREQALSLSSVSRAFSQAAIAMIALAKLDDDKDNT